MASYYVWSGAAGSANGTSWVNAYTTLTAAFSGKVAGDVFYVAHDHAESSATALTLTSNGTYALPTKIICASRAGSVPPVSADRRTTATVSTTGNVNITFTGFAHYDGIIFNAGNSTGASNIQFNTSSTTLRFDNCSLRLGSTGTGKIAQVATGTRVELHNTTASFSGVGQGFTILGSFIWRNTAAALIGSQVPTNLFTAAASSGGDLECIGVDFSAAGAGKTLCGAIAMHYKFKLIDCKLNASVTKSSVPQVPGTAAEFIRAGATGINYSVQVHGIFGLLIEETTIVRTGGASDGTTPISWKVVTTANCTYSMPFECPPIAVWNDSVGSPKTATIECVGTAIATDEEVWIDLEYLGDASSPQGWFVNDGKADLLATAANQATSSATWGGALTGKFKLEVTFTPQQKGWVYARLKCAKASSTFYLDPLITLT